MKRRELLYSITVLSGYTFLGGSPILQGCKLMPDKQNLADIDTDLLDELGDTIIPATASSPGAKAAGIGQFIKMYVTDCYTKADQNVFIDGIRSIDEKSNYEYGKPFYGLTSGQKEKILSVISSEAVAYHAGKKDDQPDHFCTMLQELTVLGYFTSEVGATKALRYVPVPGKYVGEIENKKDDKCWATV